MNDLKNLKSISLRNRFEKEHNWNINIPHPHFKIEAERQWILSELLKVNKTNNENTIINLFQRQREITKIEKAVREQHQKRYPQEYGRDINSPIYLDPDTSIDNMVYNEERIREKELEKQRQERWKNIQTIVQPEWEMDVPIPAIAISGPNHLVTNITPDKNKQTIELLQDFEIENNWDFGSDYWLNNSE